MLASHTKAVHLRVDTIEQAIRNLCSIEIESEGYNLAYRVASDNLNIGNSVVADSCNTIKLSRDEWEDVAEKCNVNFINIEIQCSNNEEHKSRVENRKTNISNFKLPTWLDVKNREYEAWSERNIHIDTATQTIDKSFSELLLQLGLSTKD